MIPEMIYDMSSRASCTCPNFQDAKLSTSTGIGESFDQEVSEQERGCSNHRPIFVHIRQILLVGFVTKDQLQAIPLTGEACSKP